MPLNETNDKSFAGMDLNVGGDIIRLHYVYFIEKDNEIIGMETSLNNSNKSIKIPGNIKYSRNEIANENNNL